MATFSLSSIHWNFGLVAATVVLAAFAVAILAILVLILANVFSCCYDFCNNLRHAAREDGLQRTLDDVAPPTVYSDSTAPRGGRPDDNACAICLDELAAGAEVRVLPRCKHTFHKNCIDPWLLIRSKSTCPLCRDPVTVFQPTSNGDLDLESDDNITEEGLPNVESLMNFYGW